MLGTPPALILSQDQTLHKIHGAFDSSIFADWSAHRSLGKPCDSDCESESTARLNDDRSVINCSGSIPWCGHPVEPESPQHESHDSHKPGQTKTWPFRNHAPVWPGRRPTDLCATALFSFQGTDASAQPISDRITDRTGEARRQSQRWIGYHWLSSVSMPHGSALSTVSSTADPAVRPLPAGHVTGQHFVHYSSL